MSDDNDFDHTLIHKYIEAYKDDLHDIWEEEKYKWEAVKHFQIHWDIDDPDFEEVIELTIPNSKYQTPNS